MTLRRTRTARGALAIAAAAVIALVASGCTQVTDDGPWRLDNEGAGYCAPASTYPDVALVIPVILQKDASISIDDIVAVGATGLKLYGYRIITTGDSVSNFQGWNDFVKANQRAYVKSAAAVGAKVKSTQTQALLMRMATRDPKQKASITGFDIHYTSGITHYVGRAHFSVELAAGACRAG